MSSWGSPPSPLRDQLYSLTFPPESPRSPRAHLAPESHSMTRSASEPTSLLYPDIRIYGPISQQAYQEDNGAHSSLSPQTNMAAIQQSTKDFSAAIIPVDKGSNHPVTQRQAPLGADGFAELSMTGLCFPSLHSTHPSAWANEKESSPNFRPAVQARRHVSLTSPIVSRQHASAGGTHS